MVTRLIRWWQWLALPWRRWQIVLSVGEADEVPGRIPPMSAVIVDAESGPKWLAFDCPCSRHHRVLLNLSPRRKPRWSVQSQSPLSLIPSVDEFSNGERCHYVVHRGKVRWVERRQGGRYQ